MRPIHHIGYWVDDIDAGMASFADALGVGPFMVIDHVIFTAFAMPGRPGEVTFDHAAAFAVWGPIVLELNAAHAIDDELASWLKPVPGTISHVSWLASDLDAEVWRLRTWGCELINTAATGPVRVAWVSGGTLFGHPIEIHLDTEFIRGMRNRLEALGHGWDGRELRRPMST